MCARKPDWTPRLRVLFFLPNIEVPGPSARGTRLSELTSWLTWSVRALVCLRDLKRFPRAVTSTGLLAGRKPYRLALELNSYLPDPKVLRKSPPVSKDMDSNRKRCGRKAIA
ncbi:hypothetical protein ALC56_08529 [Trachymyrmex septentrionalis]|uniref:Uncharacterized protein n=1 Tax=Trachymyrmex septentrionalis TaxID=34720 RepID=A0A195F8H6_9HYME|nr:hypothetical protein ALC56_08529 [Trachymyrmex septentrionalis]